jgi:hypothetical protein
MQQSGFAFEGMNEMQDALLIYRNMGCETREDYLREVAHDHGLAYDCVRAIASHLGEAEDFGKLLAVCERRMGRRH